ncbi:hypothetical protein JL49_20750 [Pseudoalteromonas luteoviolacea]|nr:hypothetical protein JL49_20750 [Pseudoalteromonas luteoviolacea]
MKRYYVHVITNFTETGGAELMMIRAINASSKECGHIIVSLMDISDSMKSRLTRPVEFHALGASSAFDLIKAAFKLSQFTKKRRIAIKALYSWMYHANFVAAVSHVIGRKNFPLVWGVRHSLDDLSGEKLSTKLAIYGGKLLSQIPSHIVNCSRKSMEQHIEFGYGSEPQSVHIPNGYSFNSAVERHFDPTKLVFGAAGRFHDAKDYKMLFKSVAPILAENPAFRIKAAGRDISFDNEELVGYLDEYNINYQQVELLGQISDMESFYNSVDFFILSSKTEGFPNVLAESSAYGCISFSTRVGDAPIIIDSTRIVEVQDDISMTTLLQKFIEKSPVELKEISNSSSDYVRTNFEISCIANKLFSLGKA